MERLYAFAGMELVVSIPEENRGAGERLLSPFFVEKTEHPHRFSFRRVERLTPPMGEVVHAQPDFCVYGTENGSVRYFGGAWQNAYLRVEHTGYDHTVEVLASPYNRMIGEKTVLTAFCAEHLLAQAGGFLLHCAFVKYQNRGILFTAPSETGKSTQAELWRKYRGARIVNGDRCGVKICDGAPWACGVPFAGSSEYCENESVPIAAVVYLSQAPETSIRRLRGYAAFSRIWEGCSVNLWDRQDVEPVSEAVRTVAETVPVFYLACTPDESAVRALEQAMGG